jgi:quinohemoprotein ethanol dehydrogenase
LWSFDAQVGIIGAPITYKVGGRQYVSVMAGFGGLGAMMDTRWNARMVKRRILTFALDADAQLPVQPTHHDITPIKDDRFERDPSIEHRGAAAYVTHHCDHCHGPQGIAGGAGPDLRESGAILLSAAFQNIVRGGALLERGMPKFDDLSPSELESIRQYLRACAKNLTRPDSPGGIVQRHDQR